MNREILFRGKDADHLAWREGLPVRSTEPPYRICAISLPGKQTLVQINPETLGQFTGLTNKNGVKIFEGDIVRYDDSSYNAYCTPKTGVIVWGKFGWMLKYTEYDSVCYYSVGSDDFFEAKSEIIGNIHDNPELLEETENG